MPRFFSSGKCLSSVFVSFNGKISVSPVLSLFFLSAVSVRLLRNGFYTTRGSPSSSPARVSSTHPPQFLQALSSLVTLRFSLEPFSLTNQSITPIFLSLSLFLHFSRSLFFFFPSFPFSRGCISRGLFASSPPGLSEGGRVSSLVPRNLRELRQSALFVVLRHSEDFRKG